MGARAFDMEEQIPDKIAQERYDEIMSQQRQITMRWCQKRVGESLTVLIEEAVEDKPLHGRESSDSFTYSGRTEFDAPEVDGQVFVTSRKPLRIGQFATTRITDALEYDLIGEVD